jgi:hypothetical protein
LKPVDPDFSYLDKRRKVANEDRGGAEADLVGHKIVIQVFSVVSANLVRYAGR